MSVETVTRPLFRTTRGGPRLTDEQLVERVRVAREAIETAGGDRGAAAAALGIARNTLNDIVQTASERARGAQPHAASYQITPGPPDIGGWRAACMEPAEWDAWTSANRLAGQGRLVSNVIPCADCLAGFAAEMRAEGRCNGTPRGDDEMDQPETGIAPLPPANPSLMGSDYKRPARTRKVALDVTAPPCLSCAHEPVCALRMALVALDAVETTAPPLPAGLRLSLVATVDCDHFLRDRAKSGPVITAEGREAMRRNGLSNLAKAREGLAAKRAATKEGAASA